MKKRFKYKEKDATQYLLDCINLDGYGIPDNATPQEQFNAAYKIFMDEIGSFSIPRYNNSMKAVSEWLRGMCCVAIAHKHEEVQAVHTKLGRLKDEPTENAARLLLDSHFDFFAMRLLGVWRKSGINI